MMITKISYRRTFNLGNYESETIEMTADVDLTDTVSDTFERLKITVYNMAAEQFEIQPVRETSGRL